jgi:hypothetical protein
VIGKTKDHCDGLHGPFEKRFSKGAGISPYIAIGSKTALLGLFS